jgi:hypothetical protein
MGKIAKSIQFEPVLLKKVDLISKSLKISRNQAIEEGIKYWIDIQERRERKKQLQKASKQVRKESLKENEDWEKTLKDGLGGVDE